MTLHWSLNCDKYFNQFSGKCSINLIFCHLLTSCISFVPFSRTNMSTTSFWVDYQKFDVFCIISSSFEPQFFYENKWRRHNLLLIICIPGGNYQSLLGATKMFKIKLHLHLWITFTIAIKWVQNKARIFCQQALACEGKLD